MNGGARKPEESAGGRRSAARLAAVQALYQLDFGGGEPLAVVEEFRKHRLVPGSNEGNNEGPDLIAADVELFSDVVLGTVQRQDEIDRSLEGALDKSRSLGRLEHIMQALLRAGTYELAARVDIPARVIISEYVDIAHAFFAGGEPGFANGVLDRVARGLRPEEMNDGQPRKAG